MKEHKHAEVIRAYTAGHKIEWKDPRVKNDQWTLCEHPAFYESYHYRVYQEPKPDVVWFFNVYPDGSVGSNYGTPQKAYNVNRSQHASVVIKLTYDGNTRKLKAAEVVQ